MSIQNSDAALKAAQAQLPVAVLKTANFSASAGTSYAVDTTAGGVTATLPASPSAGQIVIFADARGTWGSNALTVNPNGGKIEGGAGNLVYALEGTEFSLIYIDSTRGWSVYASNSVPILVGTLAAPTGTTQVGQILTASSGAWIGSPTSYLYQWENSGDGVTWTNVSGATGATYTLQSSDNGLYVACQVTAANSNGSSLPVLSAPTAIVTAPTFPSGAVAYYHLGNDGAGNLNTLDSTSNHYDLTNTNGVALGAGFAEGFAVFNGDTTLNNASLLNSVPAAVSISFWLKFNPAGHDFHVIGDWFEGNYLFDFYPYSGDNYGMNFAAADAQIYSTNFSPSNLADGGWHNCVGTSDGVTLQLYLDGQFIGSAGGSSLQSCSNFFFGGAYGYGEYVGNLCEIGVWDRVLSPTEISLLYGGGTPPVFVP